MIYSRRKDPTWKIVVFYMVFWLMLIVGEVRCIIKAVECNWNPIGKAEIVYTVAALTGAGAVVGYINIEDN